MRIFGTLITSADSPCKNHLEINHFLIAAYTGQFGRAGALNQGMMLRSVEKLESTPRPVNTREHVRELLEGLRGAYQSLSVAERNRMKSIVWRIRARSAKGTGLGKGPLPNNLLKAKFRKEI